jgi:hypothetical protein
MGHFYVGLSVRTGAIRSNNIALYQMLNIPLTKKTLRNQRRKVYALVRYMHESG